MNISELIKIKREELNESQEEFGKRFGISHAAVSDMERGITKSYASEVIRFIFTFEKRRCPSCKGKGFIESFKNIAV